MSASSNHSSITSSPLAGLCVLRTTTSRLEPFAATPEGYALGGRVKVGASYGWLLTPPQDQEGMNLLIRGALGLPLASVPQVAYHGIFLSHTSTDQALCTRFESAA